MKLNIYAVKDLKSHSLTPTYDMNDMTAKRNFAFAMNNSENLMHFAPVDFALYRIGVYDNDKCEITGYDPVLICRGEDVIDA